MIYYLFVPVNSCSHQMQFEFCRILKLRPLNTKHLLTLFQIPKVAQFYGFKHILTSFELTDFN